MNLWIKRDLSWQLLGRHVGLISQVPSDTAGAVI
jgi:hypothetical protein